MKASGTFSIQEKIQDWLLEEDESNYPVRYLTMKHILVMEDQNTKPLREKMIITGPIADILSKQGGDGYWCEPGEIYYPKYTATNWQMILLAQMGADGNHPQIRKAGENILENNRTPFGAISLSRTQAGCAHCLQGNLCEALLDLGFGNDSRLMDAVEWMARSVTGEGFSNASSGAMRYMRSGISGPGFLCSSNDHQPCAWGAVKVALALAKIPKSNRSKNIQSAILACQNFLLSVDPAEANYPHPYTNKPSGSWFKFGFPLFYVTDVLQNLEALIALGLVGEPRLKNAIDLVNSKQNSDGTWNMEYTYNGKMWVTFEEKGKPSKWVTYRALQVLRNYYQI